MATEEEPKLPKWAGFLREPARYKVVRSGRGAGKSWSFAAELVLQGAKRPLRIMCARETMESIKDSVHRLLCDAIERWGLGSRYSILKSSIVGVNGTEFLFAGLRHNIEARKSLEGCDICWIEEAQSVSWDSWSVLIPTIRKDGSEIWVSWNPDLEDDATYQMFVVNPPPGAVVKEISWRDNPWFPPVLRQEMDHLKATDYDEYLHVWEGKCINVLKGAIYANELRAAEAENRITRVPYDRTRPVDCFWDLGHADATAIWFVQSFPFEFRVIDYLESSGHDINWYLREMQARGYVYGNDWLPWDLGLHAKQMGSGRSIEELMRLAGRKVRISPKLEVHEGINALRTLFGQMWFDSERCKDGLQALRHYRYGEIAATGETRRVPLHDWSSHGADALRYFAVASKKLTARPPQPEPTDWRPTVKSPWV